MPSYLQIIFNAASLMLAFLTLSWRMKTRDKEQKAEREKEIELQRQKQDKELLAIKQEVAMQRECIAKESSIRKQELAELYQKVEERRQKDVQTINDRMNSEFKWVSKVNERLGNIEGTITSMGNTLSLIQQYFIDNQKR